MSPASYRAAPPRVASITLAHAVIDLQIGSPPGASAGRAGPRAVRRSWSPCLESDARCRAGRSWKSGGAPGPRGLQDLAQAPWLAGRRGSWKSRTRRDPHLPRSQMPPARRFWILVSAWPARCPNRSGPTDSRPERRPWSATTMLSQVAEAGATSQSRAMHKFQIQNGEPRADEQSRVPPVPALRARYGRHSTNGNGTISPVGRRTREQTARLKRPATRMGLPKASPRLLWPPVGLPRRPSSLHPEP
jgi:hypothetical protein